MRVSLKFLGFLWLGLFLIIGILLFNAYSKLKPDTFIALLTEQVQKNYPGSKLNVGKISYRFSLDFNLNLQNIHLRRSDKLLASIGEVELKVPWWLLLSNQGNAQINLKDLDIYVDHQSTPATAGGQTPAAIIPDTIKVEVPAYLVDANFTLRAKEISVRDIDSGRRYFVVSKLLVREFQYGKNSAFEINVPITIKHKNANYQSDLWLFGDVTPETSQWKLNYRGEFKTKEVNDKFQIDDLVIGGVATFIPSTLNVNSDLNLEIEKRHVGRGVFTADQEFLSFNMTFSDLPVSYLGFINEEIKNPFLIDPGGEAAGNFRFQRSYDSHLAKVSAKVNFNGDFYLTNAVRVPGAWQLTVQDSKWELSFMSPKGEASFFRRSVVDLKTAAVSQYIEEIGFSGMSFDAAIAPVLSLNQFQKDSSSLYYTSTISYKKCLLGEEIVDGQFKYGVTPEQKFYMGEISKGPAHFKMNFSSKADANAADVTFKNFIWHSSFKFLSPYFHAQEGKLNGKLEGRWSDTWENGQWLIQLSGSQLSETEGKIPEFINRTASFFDLKTGEGQNLNLSARNGILSLNSLMLEDGESAKITGSLSSKQKSFLTLSFPKNKKVKPVRKEVIEPYWMQKEEL